MARGMIIDVDHMGSKTTASVLDYCSGQTVQIPTWMVPVLSPGEMDSGPPKGGGPRPGPPRSATSPRAPYPVISAHTSFRAVSPRRNWGQEARPGPGQRATIEFWPHESAKADSTARRIVAVGGMLAPITCLLDTVQDTLQTQDPPVAPNASGSSKSYAQQLRHATALSDQHGVGIGTDMDLLTQVSPRFGPLACYGLTGEGDAGYVERTTQAINQRNGVRYSAGVSGRPRFFVPDDPFKKNPYPQVATAEIVDSYDFRAFATDVWRALWLVESGQPATDSDSQDVHNLVLGFSTPAANVASLNSNGPAQTACQMWHGVPITDAGDPEDSRTMQHVLANCIAGWRHMREGLNVPLDRCTAGSYTFDFNTDGLAHYGLLPDLFQDLQNVGVGQATLGSLFSSAEEYIQVWDRCAAMSDQGERVTEIGLEATHANIETLINP